LLVIQARVIRWAPISFQLQQTRLERQIVTNGTTLISILAKEKGILMLSLIPKVDFRIARHLGAVEESEFPAAYRRLKMLYGRGGCAGCVWYTPPLVFRSKLLLGMNE